MFTLKIIRMYILSDCRSGFFQIAVLCQISFLIFKVSESSLNHDVVCPAAFSIHVLTNFVFLQEFHILITGKLASLIRILNHRLNIMVRRSRQSSVARATCPD